MLSTQTTETSINRNDKSLIRCVEVWSPGDNPNLLTRTAASSVESGFLNQSPQTVKCGEGIVGESWQRMSALVIDIADPLANEWSIGFEESLSAVVAIPIFQQQQVQGVAILGLGSGNGAAEVWSRDDRDELSMINGHYGGLPSFEFITQYTRFPKGAGVPGNVWKTGELQMAQGLETSSAFVRSFGNDPAVISAAIGIPISASRGFAASVLLLLEAADCPLAAKTILWTVDETRIQKSTSIGDPKKNSADEWEQQVMRLVSDAQGPVMVDGNAVTLPAGASFDLAVPIFNRTQMTGVLNFMF